MKGMRIPILGKLITDCWETAERELRKNVRRKFRDRDEEIITELFRAELEVEFERVSRGAVAKAFLSDLKQTFPAVADGSLFKIARGLIATVSFHQRQVEGETGGDLGIVLVRPDVRRSLYKGSVLTLDHDYRRGLLCQAKIFRRDSTWGGFTEKQKKTLAPERLEYFSLLLYRYDDQHGERRELAPFAWQLARNATVDQVGVWLASNHFPELQDSRRLLGGLLRDQIGTDDKELIAKYVAPPLRSSLVIRIRWKDDDDPGETVRVQERSTAQTQPQVIMRRG